jgi:hypothetical protein
MAQGGQRARCLLCKEEKPQQEQLASDEVRGASRSPLRSHWRSLGFVRYRKITPTIRKSQ